MLSGEGKLKTCYITCLRWGFTNADGDFLSEVG